MYLIIYCKEYSQILVCACVNLRYTEKYSLLTIHRTRHREMINRENLQLNAWFQL